MQALAARPAAPALRAPSPSAAAAVRAPPAGQTPTRRREQPVMQRVAVHQVCTNHTGFLHAAVLCTLPSLQPCPCCAPCMHEGYGGTDCAACKPGTYSTGGSKQPCLSCGYGFTSPAGAAGEQQHLLPWPPDRAREGGSCIHASHHASARCALQVPSGVSVRLDKGRQCLRVATSPAKHACLERTTAGLCHSRRVLQQARCPSLPSRVPSRHASAAATT